MSQENGDTIISPTKSPGDYIRYYSYSLIICIGCSHCSGCLGKVYVTMHADCLRFLSI